MKLYKTTLIVEVVGEEPMAGRSLSEVHYAITEGESSGIIRDERVRELTEYQAAKELIFQGSDVNFLLPDWVPCPSPTCAGGYMRVKRIQNRKAVDTEIQCPVCQGVAMVSPATFKEWVKKRAVDEG